MSGPIKVGDKVVLEARVRRVDAETFTIRIGDLTPITLPHDHPSVISVSTDNTPARPPQRQRKKTEAADLLVPGVAPSDRERDRRKWR